MTKKHAAFILLAAADLAALAAALWQYADAGAFLYTFLAERTLDAAADFSFGDPAFGLLFLAAPLSALLLYVLLPVSAYGFIRRRRWVKWAVLAQLPLRLADFSPSVPYLETAAAEKISALLPPIWQARALIALLLAAELGKALWVWFLTRKTRFQTASKA
ncbi:TPA: hypothetical protein ACFNMI_000066 [Neisseria bacilliformis]|jgi:hypothetical protein|uniref:Integral membrane protein n=1 Tax=Neisseria bacilliformis ATCC BAA-1200 TaxID=888742 RepID=F2BGS0_9NEIS|nr:hypothetical protein [Neisseria bacilliformis]EGF06049.1 hypothetical protein HMPREF9123_2927 [Neisseria bacilliformis ATCC BAA-1200]QMT47377.1 hypothetical protein H3L91_10830 [Neisseria bacilliformis]